MNATPPIEISVTETKLLMDGPTNVLLLDCRETDEVAAVSITGSLHIPMGEIIKRVAELHVGGTERLVVHCHLGGRSLQVAQWLRQNGFPSAQSMAGGIEAWATEIEPDLPHY